MNARYCVVIISLLSITTGASALQLFAPGVKDGGPLKKDYVACVYSPTQRQVVHANNQSPALRWKKVPKGTKSFVLMMTDSDVPADRRNVNVPGKVIADNVARRTVYHWLVTDIPTRVRKLRKGKGSLPPIHVGEHVKQVRQSWASVASYQDPVSLSESYIGPCPPSNDQRVHRYYFNLYALDVASVPKKIDIKQLMQFVSKHALAQASLTTTWSNKP